MKLDADLRNARMRARFFAQNPFGSAKKPASPHPSVICHMTHMKGDQFCLAAQSSLGIPEPI